MYAPVALGSVIALLATLAPAKASSYFVITHPTKGSQWVNGLTNFAAWTIGAGQDINTFDVELARLNTDGLLFVARNVPTTAATLPINLTNVTPADDYFLLFLNSTHGLMHTMSQRFTILPAGQEPSNTTASGIGAKSAKLATVSVSGPPSPTSSFAYTFAPVSRAKLRTCASTSTVGFLASALMLWACL